MKLYVYIWNNNLLQTHISCTINHSVAVFAQVLFCCFYFFVLFIIPQLHSALALDNKERQIDWGKLISDLNWNCFSLLCHLQQRKHLLNFVFHSTCFLRFISFNLKFRSKQPDKQILKTSSKSRKYRLLQHQYADRWRALKFELTQHIHENHLIYNCLVFLNHWIPHGQKTATTPRQINVLSRYTQLFYFLVMFWLMF